MAESTRPSDAGGESNSGGNRLVPDNSATRGPRNALTDKDAELDNTRFVN